MSGVAPPASDAVASPERWHARWLSQGVPKAEAFHRQIRVDIVKAAREYSTPAWERMLWSLDTPTKGVLLSLLVWATLVDVALCASLVFPVMTDSGVAERGGNLGTIAQVVGGVFAAILAVVIFGIQSLAARNDEMAILVPYMARRRFAVPVAGLAAGATLAAVTLDLLLDGTPRMNESLSTAVGLGGLFAGVLASIWLFVNVVADVSVPKPRDIVRLVLWDMVEVIAKARWTEEIEKRMSPALEGLVVDADVIDLHMRRETRETIVEVYLPVGQFVEDIDLKVLRRLDTRLRALGSQLGATLTVGVGSEARTDPAIVIWRPKPGPPGDAEIAGHDAITLPGGGDAPTAPAALPIPDRTRAHLEKIARGVFRPGDSSSSRSDELNSHTERLYSLVIEAARAGDISRLGRSLKLVENLSEAWLRIPGAAASSAWRHTWLEPRSHFAGPINRALFDVVRAATETNELGAAETVCEFLTSMYYHASRVDLGLTVEMGRMLSFAYWRCCRADADGPQLRDLFERHLHLVLARAPAPAIWRDREGVSLSPDDRRAWEAAIGFGVDLVKTAIEEERGEDAARFIRYLLGEEAQHRQRTHPMQALTLSSVAGLREAGFLYLSGWALLLHTSKVKGAAAALKALQASLPRHSANVVDVIALWEQMGDRTNPMGMAGPLFGADRWRLERNTPYGHVSVGDTPWQWSTAGLAARLLVASHADKRTVNRCLAQPPPAGVWDPARIEGTLREVAGVLGLGDQADARVAAVLKIITDRAMALERPRVLAWIDYRPQALEGTIAAPVCEKNRIGALRELGVARPALLTGLVPSQIRLGVMRESLVRDSSAGVPHEERLLEHFCGQDEMDSIAQAERLVPELGPPAPLYRVAESVQSAIRALRERGFQPNLVLVPRGDQFLLPFLGVEGLGRHGRALKAGPWCARIDDLTVMTWPDMYAETIVVADAAALYGLASDGEDIAWRIEDTAPEALKAARDKALAATKLSELPSTNDVRAVLDLKRGPSLGLVDPTAALRISITNERAEYAVIAWLGVVHRSACPHVQHEDEYVYLPAIPTDGPLTRVGRCRECIPEPSGNAGSPPPGD